MSGQMGSDPELDLAELWLDIGDLFEAHFERWAQEADDEPNPILRKELAGIAADAMAIANAAMRSLSVDHPSHDLCRLPRGVIGLFGTADDALDLLTIAERCCRRQSGKPVQSVDPVFHAYEHIM
jgi:hypothetical protein